MSGKETSKMEEEMKKIVFNLTYDFDHMTFFWHHVSGNGVTAN